MDTEKLCLSGFFYGALMRNVATDFIAEKNKQANKPIFLYIIFDIDNQGTNKYFCAYDTNIVFDGQVYEKFPISHEPITENTQGQIDHVNVTVSNISRLIRYYLGQYDGLRDKKVVIRQVFANLLDNADAKIDDTFFVKQVTCNQQDVTLTLSSKLDILSVNLPGRTYTRTEFPGIPYQRTIVAW